MRNIRLFITGEEILTYDRLITHLFEMNTGYIELFFVFLMKFSVKK